MLPASILQLRSRASSLGYLHDPVVKCPDRLQEQTASNFKGRRYWIDKRKKMMCWFHRTVWANRANHSNRREECPEQMMGHGMLFWAMFIYTFLNQLTFLVYLKICMSIENNWDNYLMTADQLNKSYLILLSSTTYWFWTCQRRSESLMLLTYWLLFMHTVLCCAVLWNVMQNQFSSVQNNNKCIRTLQK
jgi:hypothetical protein